MKPGRNKDIDLLLRNLGERSRTVPGDEDNRNAEVSLPEHLDTDELQAYAENALPAAARVRYTEHLADCTRCRQIVTQINLAAGLVAEEKKPEVRETSGIRAFLHSFLSPVVLRYAVPALALITVAFLGLTVFRQSANKHPADLSNEPHIAQKGEVSSQVGITKPNDNQNPGGDSGDSAAKVSQSENKSSKPETRTRTDARREADEEQPSKEQPTGAVDQIAAAPPAPSAPPSSNVIKAAEAPAEPKAAVSDEKTKKTEDVAKRKVVSSEPQGVASTATVQTNEKQAGGPAKEPERTVGGFVGERAGAGNARAKNQPLRENVETQERSRGRDQADKDDQETRTVAGKRFRKAGSVWIDAAYDSQPTTNVTRGSEQYRALVADEPVIRSIAEQLGGEVIIVWKGHAYRIR